MLSERVRMSMVFVYANITISVFVTKTLHTIFPITARLGHALSTVSLLLRFDLLLKWIFFLHGVCLIKAKFLSFKYFLDQAALILTRCTTKGIRLLFNHSVVHLVIIL